MDHQEPLKKRNPPPIPRIIRYPDLEITQILIWADAYYARHEKWPSKNSGSVAEAPGTTWCAIDLALKRGNRGLARGSSLSRLLQEWRSARNIHDLPTITVDHIQAWVDSHRERTGRWPTKTDAEIEEAPEEKWYSIDHHLRHGGRGLPGGTSLGRLIATERRVRNQTNITIFTVDQVLAWADAHYQRTGKWPVYESGPIPEAPGENWKRVQNALLYGLRGLPGGSSLAQFLNQHRRK